MALQTTFLSSFPVLRTTKATFTADTTVENMLCFVFLGIKREQALHFSGKGGEGNAPCAPPDYVPAYRPHRRRGHVTLILF